MRSWKAEWKVHLLYIGIAPFFSGTVGITGVQRRLLLNEWSLKSTVQVFHKVDVLNCRLVDEARVITVRGGQCVEHRLLLGRFSAGVSEVCNGWIAVYDRQMRSVGMRVVAPGGQRVVGDRRWRWVRVRRKVRAVGRQVLGAGARRLTRLRGLVGVSRRAALDGALEAGGAVAQQRVTRRILGAARLGVRTARRLHDQHALPRRQAENGVRLGLVAARAEVQIHHATRA